VATAEERMKCGEKGITEENWPYNIGESVYRYI
jgi:hypothetical protein